ncbi:hypothetical protein QFC21_001049 [Naganishia friedmannii]|uniref:Uncharacterized protein n=1 Tax=Naganishia friedmannii TaxID=89922 RepID=A0ACC2W756_9TREE|nr:hypothetical protein QFC21_001049 [Naganishia friedmannii]
MPYEHTSLPAAQAATIQLLVSQVARAFFDPPYTVILERLMQTRDLWGEMELTHAVGLGQAKKELHKFMVGLMKQRLVKRWVGDAIPSGATERSEYQSLPSEASISVLPSGASISYESEGLSSEAAVMAAESLAFGSAEDAAVRPSISQSSDGELTPFPLKAVAERPSIVAFSERASASVSGFASLRAERDYVNTERKLDQAIVNGKFTRPNVQRTYYYIDYHDFTDVVKYRLAVMRQKLEATLKVEVNQNDYVCPLCKKQFNQLDVASLVALSLSSNSSSNSAFDLNCDVCGTEIVQKSKVSGAQQAGREMDVVNARMQRFNEQTMGIRGTLQRMEKIRYEKIDPLAWLIRHIPETVVFELDEDGNPIKGSDVLKPKELAAAQAAHAASGAAGAGMVVVEDEETRVQREEEQRRAAERQKMQNALPVWHTHSTISGDQTGLGISHELLRQSRAPNPQGRTGNGAGGIDGDGRAVQQDDLSAYYASLNAQSVAGETNIQEPAVKHEHTTASTSAVFVLAQGKEEEDDDDEMVDVSGGPSTSAAVATSRPPPPAAAVAAAGDEDEFEETPSAAAASVSGSQAPTETGEGDVDPGTIVMVNGEAMTFAQVQDNEDLLDQMTADEYSVRINRGQYVLSLTRVDYDVTQAYFRLLDG